MYVVERAVGEREWPAEVGHVQCCVVAQSASGQLEHRRAAVDAGHQGTLRAQRRGQGPGSTPGIEDSVPLDVPGQVDHRRPLVVGVEEARLVLRRVVLGEIVVVVGLHQSPLSDDVSWADAT
jgi:hypothetical protein